MDTLQYQHCHSVDQDGEEISAIRERDELLWRRKIDPCAIIVIITVPILHQGSRNNCEVIILIILQLNNIFVCMFWIFGSQ
jgi:hypothetical protein